MGATHTRRLWRPPRKAPKGFIYSIMDPTTHTHIYRGVFMDPTDTYTYMGAHIDPTDTHIDINIYIGGLL